MRRWRWGFPVPFPTSFASLPKRTYDHRPVTGEKQAYGVFVESVCREGNRPIGCRIKRDNETQKR
jgi:hypothetical protein